jgi:ABC-type transporter Mla MlaB component
MKLDAPQRLQAAMLDEVIKPLVALAATEALDVDASQVERIDTAGLQLLLVLRQRPNTTLTVSQAVSAAAEVVGLRLP